MDGWIDDALDAKLRGISGLKRFIYIECIIRKAIKRHDMDYISLIFIIRDSTRKWVHELILKDLHRTASLY